MVFFSNRCWEDFVGQERVDDLSEGVKSFLPARLVDERALVDQLVAHRPNPEMDQLLQVLHFLQAQFVVQFALGLVFQDGVLRERLTVLNAVLGQC